MAMDTASLMGFAVLGSMKKAERKRAQTPLVLTLVPGAPATRAAISTIAVGNQARDGLRRERKAAEAVISAVGAVVSGQPAVTAFAGQPALRDLGPDVLAARFTAVTARAVEDDEDEDVEPDRGGSEKELWNALELATSMLIAAVGRTKNQLFTPEEAAAYDAYLDLLSDDTRARIVKPAEAAAEIDVVT